MGIIDEIEGDLIYLDTNIVIYALEGYPEYVSLLTDLFSAIDEGDLTAATSELTLAEALIKPMMDGNSSLEKLYLETLSPSSTLSIIPIDRSILIEAARLRSRIETLHLPDAIHLATARIHQCNSFLTNDRRLRNLPDVNVVLLSESVSGHGMNQ
ncbi:PIN domain-containing protein [Methanocalculus taiwanensis]|jgi:predicted nucleic acid-binding protein|uniref:PIN domain-containing protein n=1 Tax=Methanocalculus taiwanensis TaxID=106207 RepID=A0ABD4THV6_9EURY|nr:PIN domain-containing protein [Methanocalculus taiwanensis]MCQ1538276.1 PIN domain-containing protein [Methanocalculus taiwanensis]